MAVNQYGLDLTEEQIKEATAFTEQLILSSMDSDVMAQALYDYDSYLAFNDGSRHMLFLQSTWWKDEFDRMIHVSTMSLADIDNALVWLRRNFNECQTKLKQYVHESFEEGETLGLETVLEHVLNNTNIETSPLYIAFMSAKSTRV